MLQAHPVFVRRVLPVDGPLWDLRLLQGNAVLVSECLPGYRARVPIFADLQGDPTDVWLPRESFEGELVRSSSEARQEPPAPEGFVRMTYRGRSWLDPVKDVVMKRTKG
jgi:hypothetical protein